MYVLNEPAFKCEESAYEYIETKLWPDGPVCPHCEGRERIGRLRGQSTKVGTYKCYACRKPFNVKIGTMLESTHVPLHMWLQALFLLNACEPGISIHRLHRVLGVSSRTTWLMAQRVRAKLSMTREADAELADDEELNSDDRADTDEGISGNAYGKGNPFVKGGSPMSMGG